MSAREIDQFLRDTGYADEGVEPSQVKLIGNDEYVMAKALMFHWTLIRGNIFDTAGYDDRWCYADRDGAMRALDEFPHDPDPDYEPQGWRRHPMSGRRRDDAGTPDSEYLNP